MKLLLVALFSLILKKMLSPFPTLGIRSPRLVSLECPLCSQGQAGRQQWDGDRHHFAGVMLLCIVSERTKGQTHHPELHSGKRMPKPMIAKLAAEKFSHSSAPKFLFGSRSVLACRVQGNSYHILLQELRCMSCILLSKG